MDAELRAAIEATIVRWAKIATAEVPWDEWRATDCALCGLARLRGCTRTLRVVPCTVCPANGVYGRCDALWWELDWGTDSERAWAVHDFAVSLLYQEEE